jgi:superfamily II DNA/RNA helicase
LTVTRPHPPVSTPDSTPVATPVAGFAALGLPSSLVDVLSGAGVTEPFPIQSATIPPALEGGDVLGRGRTGSGKTYAFLLPLVARLSGGRAAKSRRPRALILAPTRELATQIHTALQPLAAASGLRSTTVFGGVPAPKQIRTLSAGVDVLVACPGRLEDLMRSGHVDLGGVEITVLDEADHMADLGFLPGVKRIMDRTPRDGQRMLFSATLDRGVDVLVKRYLSNPTTHSVDSVQSPVIAMDHHVLHVDTGARLAVITDLAAAPGRTVVFTRTKHGAKQLSRKLNASGVGAVELHGNLSQNARTRNLAKFSDGSATTLVATDIAARGIHVDDITLVIHADPPAEHKAYLHRSGRTARAGAAGTVVTMALGHQTGEVRSLTRQAGIKPTTTRVEAGHPLLHTIAPGERDFSAPRVAPAPTAERGGQRNGSRNGGGSGGGPRRRRNASGGGAAGAANSGGRNGARRPSGSGHGSGDAGGSKGRSGRPAASGGSHSAASFSTRRFR